ncbi:deoxyribodipyrimidine photo-lyase, partial [Streptomyces sp. SID4917]|nr:deoxyribodipyrimidine photo-lyase [Streptomyces sp. SID4917]
RAALAADRRGLRVHDASVTVVQPGALVPAGKDHFAVFTPYFRRWEGFSVRGVLPAPARVPVAEARLAGLRSAGVRSAGLPRAESIAPGPVSPGLPAGGESEGRRRLRSWLAGP